MRATLAVILIVAISGVPAFGSSPTPPDPAGVIKNPTGSVSIVRGGQTIRDVKEGTVVFESDVVQTGFTGRTGLIMQDDTIISLGRRSRIVLDRFMYKPDEHKFSLILNLLRGTMLYISGRIEKLAPNTVQIQTPDAVVGVRGSQIFVEVD